jgi:hypothetical protein
VEGSGVDLVDATSKQQPVTTGDQSSVFTTLYSPLYRQEQIAITKV